MYDESGSKLIAQENIPQPVACRITDIDMPFMSMVSFMVKWAIATIPALIILGVFAFVMASALYGYTGIL